MPTFGTKAKRRGKYSRVFSDLLNEVAQEEKDEFCSFSVKAKPLTSRESRNAAPPKGYFEASRKDLENMDETMRDDVISTLRRAKQTAKQTVDDDREWAKFWEPLYTPA